MTIKASNVCSEIHSLKFKKGRSRYLICSVPIMEVWISDTSGFLAQKDSENIRGFPKIDHSGNNARIVLEQNKLSKKLPSRD